MIKGKGAQYNPSNPFHKQSMSYEHDEGIDEYTQEERPQTQLFFETPKNVVSKNDSPDLKLPLSVNPYQGCEHGCIYCYARNSHTYWGFSAGLDFESKIIVKEKVAENLEKQLLSRNWKVEPVMLSGNTDCYQPIEKKYGLTRKILQVMLKYRHPVSIITKNVLILRDIDILKELANLGLVHIYFSITSLDESLRRLMEPRTARYDKKLEAIEELSKSGIPVGIMNAPIIPGINHHEIPEVLRQASSHGALTAGYTVVRLNGQVGEIFVNWLENTFPDRADKVKHQIQELHEGSLNDSQWGRRITGSGEIASIISQLFKQSFKKYFRDKKMPPFRTDLFRKGGHYTLF